MTLLQRWRFHPAFPCPPCIPLSRCCPDRPQPWHRLPRNRLVFLRLVAMGTLFLLAWIRGIVRGFRGRGSIKHCPVLMELVDWRKPIRGVVRVWVFAGACPGVCGSPPCYGGGSCCQARSKRPVDCEGLGRAGLRRLSRRGSWVQIPPPAPYPNLRTFSWEDCGIWIPLTKEWISRVEY